MTKLTEDKERKFQAAYEWWMLSVTELKPFMTTKEWLRAVLFSKEILTRYGKESTLGEYDKASWPDNHREILESLK